MKRVEAHHCDADARCPSFERHLAGGRGPAATGAARASFKASVDLVRVSAVVRDRKGRFVQNLTARDFEVLDGGQISADQRLPPRSAGGQHRAALRRQRQHGSAYSTPARESATAPAQLARSRATRRRSSRSTTAPRRSGSRSPRAAGRCRRRMASIIPFGATSLHDAIAQTAERLESPGEQPPRGGGVHRRPRHWSKLSPSAGVGDRERDRRAGLHPRHRAARSTTRSADIGTVTARAVGVVTASLAESGALDRRRNVRRQPARGAKHRGAADCR